MLVVGRSVNYLGVGVMSRWDISLPVNGDDVTLDSTTISQRPAGVNESNEESSQLLFGKEYRSLYKDPNGASLLEETHSTSRPRT